MFRVLKLDRCVISFKRAQPRTVRIHLPNAFSHIVGGRCFIIIIIVINDRYFNGENDYGPGRVSSFFRYPTTVYSDYRINNVLILYFQNMRFPNGILSTMLYLCPI